MSKYELLKNGIAVITLINPPVNGLSKAVRSGLLAGLKQAKANAAKAIVVVGDGATFPAGADISEFASGKWTDEPDLNTLMSELDNAQTPIVAAIHGTALGGGLETALSCHYRVALPSAKLGLPEVHLGILPGAGGTQRLPRVVGVEKSIDMITTGKPVGAKEANKLGLVDHIVEGKTAEDLVKGTIEYIERSVLKVPRLPRVSERKVLPVEDSVYEEAKKTLQKKARGQLAPQKIVDAVKASSTSATFAEGLLREEQLFGELMAGNQSKALQYMFFASRSCSKVPGVDPKSARDIKSVGIIGGGTMGRGIAMCFMNKGIPVVLSETSQEALDNCVKAIEGLYKKSSAFRSGKMSESDLEARMNLIKGSTDPDFNQLKNCDAVIEAVFENMELKKGIFSKLGKVCKDETLLCSNTSYLDVDIIGESSGRPEMFLGTHFFSPANVMPLLENVRGSKTSDASIATAMKMGKTIGKTAVLAGNCFGFIGNRMFEPYVQQATCLLEEGVSPSRIDKVMYDYGFAMGPLAVMDLAGNDVPYRIRREKYYPHTPENVGGRRGGTWMALADALCDMNRLGQKTGKGWYTYDGRNKTEDAVVERLCEEHREKFNIQKRNDVSDQEILERCLYPLVNEGTRILQEGIASRSSDIDIVWASGYGAPSYSPPMFYADRVVGLKNVRDALSNYHKNFPELPHWQFQPSSLIEELAESGMSLQQYSAKK